MMRRTSPKPVATSAAESIRAALSDVSGVILDIDGTLILGDRPGEGGTLLPGAHELVHDLMDRQVPMVCLTNASANPPKFYAAELRRHGMPIEDSQVITPAVVAVHMLSGCRGPILALGSAGLIEPLVGAGLHVVTPDEPGPELPQAVIAGWDEAFDLARLRVACEAVWSGATLYTTSTAAVLPLRRGRAIGVPGAICAAITNATGVLATVTGKPAASAFQAAAEVVGVEPGRILLVGDDLAIDIAMGRSGGARTALVLTGSTTFERLAATPTGHRPDIVVQNVGGLCEILSAMLPEESASGRRQ